MAGLLVSDLVASLMTLPYGVYYFSQISVYTSLGNLLAGPVIGFWVMPALLLLLISLPFGLGAYAVRPFAAGIDVINQITAWVARCPAPRRARASEPAGLGDCADVWLALALYLAGKMAFLGDCRDSRRRCQHLFQPAPGFCLRRQRHDVCLQKPCRKTGRLPLS